MKRTLPIIAMTLCLAAVQAQEGYRSFFGQERTEWYVAAYEDGSPASDNYIVTIIDDTSLMT